MWRFSCFALLLPVLLLLCSDFADSAPFFGLFNILGGSTAANGTSILAQLVEAHLQQKINALQVLEDLATIAANVTGSALG